MKTTSPFTRRDMLKVSGMAGLATMAGITPTVKGETQQRRPRIACLASYWGATRSHADWIMVKLIDGYWWQGAHTESRVDVASIYIHQHETSELGRKVGETSGIPVYRSVEEALTLGTDELAVDGVVIIGEHGDYPKDLKGHWLLPRWQIYNQVVQVFEQSNRSVPVFNDKHLSYTWDESKWMFDKSRELNFPLTGGSSIPLYYRTPEIELDIDTPIKNSISIGGTSDEGAIFHVVDTLQAFVERRRGGETGVRSVQSIRGPETWNWVDQHPWAGELLSSVERRFEFEPGHFRQVDQTNMCHIVYNDDTQAAVIGGRGVDWTYAGEIEGQQDATVISLYGMLPSPYDQYHASNALPHWITEMMVTKEEPFNAERLLLSSGIVNHYMESNWENGRYSPVGRRLETPFLDMTYQTTRGAQFNTGERPPNRPYIRGFSE
ncbi:MAG: hypothetical protein WEA36_08395 [Balneolaceae bacterium]